MNAYKDRIRGERAENLEQAIQHSQQALAVHTRQAYPEQWAETQNNLANAYIERICGERAENLEQAIQHYQQALEVRTRQAYPVECRQTARSLGNLGFKLRNWKLALEGYELALAAQELLMRSASQRLSKEAELGEAQYLPARAAFSQTQLGLPGQGVAVLEAGRAQLLRESLERNRRDLASLPDLGFAEQHTGYLQAVQRVGDLTTLGQLEKRPADWLAQMEAAQQDLEQVIQAIRQQVGAEHPSFQTFMGSLPYEEIQALAREAPLVYLAATSAGGFALVVTAEQVETLWLDQLMEDGLREEVYGPAEDSALGGYLGAYDSWLRTQADPAVSPEVKQTATIIWQAALDEITYWLWGAVMEKIIASLKAGGWQQAVLIPGGLLSLLPLHAAWTEDAGAPTGRRYALDEITFTYAPSVRHCKKPPKSPLAPPPFLC